MSIIDSANESSRHIFRVDDENFVIFSVYGNLLDIKLTGNVPLDDSLQNFFADITNKVLEKGRTPQVNLPRKAYRKSFLIKLLKKGGFEPISVAGVGFTVWTYAQKKSLW